MEYRNGADKAKIADGKWVSDVPGMAEYLNRLSESFVLSGADPDPDYALMMWVVSVIGGKILGKAKVEYTDGVIY